MDISYPDSAEQFRERVRAFLRRELPADWTGIGALGDRERHEFERSWRGTLAAGGLLAVSWPVEYGGGGLTAIEQVVMAEEFASFGAPEGAENDTFGIRLLGNTLIRIGTDAQRRHYLPRILSGEDVWCQGFSEPGAGSDLASLRTTARLEGDHWVVNGQKTWTSAAHLANWIFVLTRTDSSVAKHKGLTFLLVPMDQPGVEVRPIKNAAGHRTFNEVFFTDAVTPARNVLGNVNGGWNAAMTLLGFERGSRVTTNAIRFRRDLDRLVSLARERGLLTDPHIRAELAWCWGRMEIMRFCGYRALTDALLGRGAETDSAISKVMWSELFQRYTEVALDILGPDALTLSGAGNGGALQIPEAGTENSPHCWTDEYLYGRAATIYAGSSQIQRNIIGERLLGLPGEPRLDRSATARAS